MGDALDNKSVEEVCSWLEGKGFSSEIRDAFEEQEMDGEAIIAALGSYPGPDCLKDVVTKLGARLKVYNALKTLCEQFQGRSIQEGSPGAVSISSPPSPTSSGGVSWRKATPSSTHSAKSTQIHTPKRSIKKANVPDPFPLPSFRVATETNLANSELLDTDKKHIVKTLATMLMTYDQRPSLSSCLIVARSLINKHQFLKDGDGTSENSWKWFIYNRTQNINRGSIVNSEHPPSSKRRKIASQDKHVYPTIPPCADDETSTARNLSLLKEEMAKAKPNPQVLKDLLARTFERRTQWIRSEDPTLSEMLQEYPLLKKSAYASQEFALLVQQENARDTFEENFVKWVQAIVLYSKSTQIRNTAIQMVVENYREDTGVEESVVMALRCLGLLLIPTKAKKAVGDIPFLVKFAPRGTTPSEAPDQHNNQPHIVVIGDEDDEMQQYFIAVEQLLILESSNMVSAVFFLIAAHYIFNMDYNTKVKDLLTFVQLKIATLPIQAGHKWGAVVGSHIHGLCRQFDSMPQQDD